MAVFIHVTSIIGTTFHFMGKVVISLHRNETCAGSPDAEYEKTLQKMHALCGHAEIIT